MDFSLISVDFDGTLANPTVRVAVIIWATFLGALLLVVFFYVRRTWQRLALMLVVLTVGYFFSRIATLGMVTSFYEARSTKPIGVGFFGSPTPWVAPILALSVAGFSTLLLGRMSRGKNP